MLPLAGDVVTALYFLWSQHLTLTFMWKLRWSLSAPPQHFMALCPSWDHGLCLLWLRGTGLNQQQHWEPSFQTMSDTSTECYIICSTEAERWDHQGAGCAPCFSVLPSYGHAGATCVQLQPVPAGRSSQRTVCQWEKPWKSLGAALSSLLWSSLQCLCWEGCWGRHTSAGGSQHWANNHPSGDRGPASSLCSPLQMVLKMTSSSLSFWRKWSFNTSFFFFKVVLYHFCCKEKHCVQPH